MCGRGGGRWADRTATRTGSRATRFHFHFHSQFLSRSLPLPPPRSTRSDLHCLFCFNFHFHRFFLAVYFFFGIFFVFLFVYFLQLFPCSPRARSLFVPVCMCGNFLAFLLRCLNFYALRVCECMCTRVCVCAPVCVCISVQNCINVFWQPLNGSTGSITSKNDDNVAQAAWEAEVQSRKPGTICATKWVV